MTCLNCATEFEGKFCPNCAQRASTQRFTLKHLLTRDFLADTFNFDRGFLHTCKAMFYRPGYAIVDYLNGQRKAYFNFIGFLLILLGIEAILWEMAVNSPAQYLVEVLNEQLSKTNTFGAAALGIEEVETVLRNQKLLFIPAIPLAAIIPYFVFRRLKFNFLEHCIIISFLLAMNTLLGIVTVGILGLLPLSFATYKVIYLPFSFIVLFFDFFVFWQIAKTANYSTGGRLWRTIIGGYMAIAIIGFTQQLSMAILTGRRVKMENERISPTELPVNQPAEETPAPGN
ncbi:MAG: DUF3667 domain-containing protein [Lewinella sp.]